METPAKRQRTTSTPRAAPTPAQVAAASARALESAARAVDALEEAAEARALDERPPLLRLPAEMLVHILRLAADDGHLSWRVRPRFVHVLNTDLKAARRVCWTLAHVVARLLDPRREAPLGVVHASIHNMRAPRQGVPASSTLERALCSVAGVLGSREADAAAAFALSAASLRPYLEARISISGAQVMRSDAFCISAAHKRKAGSNDGSGDAGDARGGLSAAARTILGRLRCVQLHVGVVTGAPMFDMAVETLASVTARPALKLQRTQALCLGAQARARLWRLVLSGPPFSDAAPSSEPAMVELEARAYAGIARLVVPVSQPPLSTEHLAALQAALAASAAETTTTTTTTAETATAVPEVRRGTVYAVTTATMALIAAFNPPKRPDGEHKRERLSARVEREPALLDGFVAPGRTLAAYVLAAGMTQRNAADLCRLLGVLRTQRGATALAALLAKVDSRLYDLSHLQPPEAMAAELPATAALAATHARLVRQLVACGAPLTHRIVAACFFVPGMLVRLPAATVLSAATRMCAERSNVLFETLLHVQLDAARDIIASAAGPLLCARTMHGGQLNAPRSLVVLGDDGQQSRHLLFDIISRTNLIFGVTTVSAARCTALERELDTLLRATVPPAFFVTPAPIAGGTPSWTIGGYADFRLTPLEGAFLWFVAERRSLMRTCALAAACGVQWRACRWLLALVLGATAEKLSSVARLEAATALIAELLEREQPDLEASVHQGHSVYGTAVVLALVRATAPAVLRLVMPPSMRSAAVRDTSRLAPLAWPG